MIGPVLCGSGSGAVCGEEGGTTAATADIATAGVAGRCHNSRTKSWWWLCWGPPWDVAADLMRRMSLLGAQGYWLKICAAKRWVEQSGNLHTITFLAELIFHSKLV